MPPDEQADSVPSPALMSRHGGFGLVELLVSLGLLAVLLAIALKGAGAVRERGVAAQCLLNLRQLAQATLLFANDHDGRFPPERIGEEGNPDGLGVQWDAQIAPYLGLEVSNATRRERTVFYCPAARKNGDARFGRSYGYNLYLSNNHAGSGRLQTIGDRSLQLILMESLSPQLNADGLSWPLFGARHNGAIVHPQKPERIVYPHRFQGHFVFADGHVAPRRPLGGGDTGLPRNVIWGNGMGVSGD
ncbi:MAG TPA: prepilin-type N-terminal cleavage/methylation domain-containing protein [Chthoniobacteraceae bacterium]|nr:prepilin-type N-terminal cleavage/methylation domain-containing protein [Chthoniobacteraceae bacterium]